MCPLIQNDRWPLSLLPGDIGLAGLTGRASCTSGRQGTGQTRCPQSMTEVRSGKTRTRKKCQIQDAAEIKYMCLKTTDPLESQEIPPSNSTFNTRLLRQKQKRKGNATLNPISAMFAAFLCSFFILITRLFSVCNSVVTEGYSSSAVLGLSFT